MQWAKKFGQKKKNDYSEANYKGQKNLKKKKQNKIVMKFRMR